jgi:hypothetical protein
MRIDPDKTYYKLATVEDILAAYYVATSGKISGRIVQEAEAPWDFWWEILEKDNYEHIADDEPAYLSRYITPKDIWEEGTPKSSVKLFTWPNLIRRSVVKPDPANSIAKEIIILTLDESVFFDIVRKHFYLQKGQIQFSIYAGSKPQYLLKITDPSLWALTTVNNKAYHVFNRVESHYGLYIARGFQLRSFNKKGTHNKLNFGENNLLLVNKEGGLLSLKPTWDVGENIIQISLKQPDIQQVSLSERLALAPYLRKTVNVFPSIFWKITDKERFKTILTNQNADYFSNFILWYKTNGTIFLEASGPEISRDIASILNDAFTPYYAMDTKVYTPINKVLSPKLSAKKLHSLLGSHSKDSICIDEHEGKVVFELLKHQDSIALDAFIILEIENIVNGLKNLKPTWSHNFVELKKKKIAIKVFDEIIENQWDPFDSAKNKNRILKDIGKQIKDLTSAQQFTLNLNDLSLLNAYQKETATYKLDAIDKQLITNPFNPKLWAERGEIALNMKIPYSYITASLTAGILSKDTPFLIKSALKYSSITTELKNLTALRVTEVERGRLLATIRNRAFTAETHYIFLLIYGVRFDDINIFSQAIEGMKTGFSADGRSFFEFNEARATSGTTSSTENRVELLSKKDLPRIRSNIAGFMRNVGGCSNIMALTAAKLQLRAMLTVHLDAETANELLGYINNNPDRPEYHQTSILSQDIYASSQKVNQRIFNVPSKFCEYLMDWQHIDVPMNATYEVKRWASLFTMEKIRETPLRDFFAGTMYTPPFYFDLKEETNRTGLLFHNKWLADQITTDSSDGKELARLIYRRFVNGHSDWNNYFAFALKYNSFKVKAQAQRILLLIVAEYGPHPDFVDYIEPLQISSKRGEIWDIYRITLYCDIFRLCLAYNIEIDQQRLFNTIVMRIPTPPKGWEDYANTAEWVVLCLLLTSSNGRRLQFDSLAQRSIRWLRVAAENENVEVFAKALTILSFIQIGILADLVPEKLELHKTIEKRKVSWIQHASALSQNLQKEFEIWKKHYEELRSLYND